MNFKKWLIPLGTGYIGLFLFIRLTPGIPCEPDAGGLFTDPTLTSCGTPLESFLLTVLVAASAIFFLRWTRWILS